MASDFALLFPARAIETFLVRISLEKIIKEIKFKLLTLKITSFLKNIKNKKEKRKKREGGRKKRGEKKKENEREKGKRKKEK